MTLRDVRSLGAALRAARHERGLNQDEVARRAGLARRTLSRIENGNVAGEIGTYLAVVRALDLSLDLVEPETGDFDLDTLDATTVEI